MTAMIRNRYILNTRNLLRSTLGLILINLIINFLTVEIFAHGSSHSEEIRNENKRFFELQEREKLMRISEGLGVSKPDKMIRHHLMEVKQDSKEETAWISLGNSLMQKARETGDENFYYKAEYAFQKAYKVNPKNIEGIVGLAWVYGGLHRFDESIAWAEKTISLDPQNSYAYGILGDAKVELGDYPSALKHYQSMLNIKPDLSSYSRAAHLLFLMGEPLKATWLMQKAIESGGPYLENTAWCRAKLASMLLNTGALKPAEEELQKAIKTVPNNYYLLEGMAKVKTAQKDFDAAIDYYQKAISITPTPQAFVALGDLYLLKGDLEKAEQQFHRCETGTGHGQSGSGTGDIFLARFYADHDRNLSEALKEAERAYTTYKNVFTTDTLAWCYYKNGRYLEALKTIKKALKWGTPDANIYYHAGMIYAKLSDQVTAKKYLYKALSINPNFHPILAEQAAQTLKELG